MEKKQLELLQSRLKKAYSLPLEEQERYREKIEELEGRMAILRAQLGLGFDENKAIGRLIQTNIEICKELKGEYGTGKFQEFLNKNSKANDLWNESTELNIAFKLNDMEYFEECLKKYKETILKIDEMYTKGVR